MARSGSTRLPMAPPSWKGSSLRRLPVGRGRRLRRPRRSSLFCGARRLLRGAPGLGLPAIALAGPVVLLRARRLWVTGWRPTRLPLPLPAPAWAPSRGFRGPLGRPAFSPRASSLSALGYYFWRFFRAVPALPWLLAAGAAASRLSLSPLCRPLAALRHCRLAFSLCRPGASSCLAWFCRRLGCCFSLPAFPGFGFSHGVPVSMEFPCRERHAVFRPRPWACPAAVIAA